MISLEYADRRQQQINWRKILKIKPTETTFGSDLSSEWIGLRQIQLDEDPEIKSKSLVSNMCFVVT